MIKSEVAHANNLVTQTTEDLVTSFNTWFEAQYGHNPARALVSRDASCSSTSSKMNGNTISARDIDDKQFSPLDSAGGSSGRMEKTVGLYMLTLAKSIVPIYSKFCTRVTIISKNNGHWDLTV